MAPDIFISYDRDDRARVQRLAEVLAQQGYLVWWDKGLRAGEDYRDRIEEMVETARCVVVAWSRASIESDFVIDEAGVGKTRRVLLPVFLDPGIQPPLGFRGIQTSDISGWLRDHSNTAQLEQFLADAAALLAAGGAHARAAAPPPAPPPQPAARSLPRWATGAGALLVAAAMVYAVTRALQPDAPRRDPDAADSTTEARPAIASPGPAVAGALGALSCLVPGDSANPLELRRQARTRHPFSVDTATHLLLDQDGEPVQGGAASSYGTLRDRRFIVVHSSGTPAGTAERYFQQPEVNASMHVMIARDGSVRQMLPFDFAARHAGASQWRGVRGLNAYSIGIDLENWGRLISREGRWYPYGFNTEVPGDHVALAVRTPDGAMAGWHAYTDAQIRAFFHVACALRRAYPTITEVVGHDSIAPGRRDDPGPMLPLHPIRARLFPGRRTSSVVP